VGGSPAAANADGALISGAARCVRSCSSSASWSSVYPPDTQSALYVSSEGFILFAASDRMIVW